MLAGPELAAEIEDDAATLPEICGFAAVELEVRGVPRAHFVDRVNPKSLSGGCSTAEECEQCSECDENSRG